MNTIDTAGNTRVSCIVFRRVNAGSPPHTHTSPCPCSRYKGNFTYLNGKVRSKSLVTFCQLFRQSCFVIRAKVAVLLLQFFIKCA